MGWNSVLVVNHDCLHEIGKDPEFGEKVKDACCSGNPNEPRSIPGGYVVQSFHNSGVCVVAAGGNCGSVLGWGIGLDGRHLAHQYRERILHQLADEYGFKLVRKDKK